MLSIDNIQFILNQVNHDYITHYSNSNWGDSILIISKSGDAFARIYWYHDDDTTVYLDWLDVDIISRKQGIGTNLQIIREMIGLKLGAKFSCLWVTKGTWMHDWYKRRGYEDWQDYTEEDNAIWMRKQIAK